MPSSSQQPGSAPATPKQAIQPTQLTRPTDPTSTPTNGNSTRRALVIGNWKMNGDLATNGRLLGALRERLDSKLLAHVEVAVCPPFPYIAQAAEQLVIAGTSGANAGANSGVRWGAQNVARTPNGAFTGEVSVAMLVDLGCDWVLVGHSERRQLFGETDEGVAARTSIAIANGIRPVICVGETLEQREAGVTEQVLGAQLGAVLPALAGVAPDRYVLAYEPVWAIGTGKTASPEQAQDVHHFLRGALASGLSDGSTPGKGSAGAAAAAQVRILYGGSVKGSNAAELFARPDVDGGLIGGAALVADDFVAICEAAAVRGAGATRDLRPAGSGSARNLQTK